MDSYDAYYAMMVEEKRCRFSLWGEDTYIYYDHDNMCFVDNFGNKYCDVESFSTSPLENPDEYWVVCEESDDDRPTIEFFKKEDMFFEGMNFVYFDPDCELYRQYTVYFVDDYVVYCRDINNEPFFILKAYIDQYMDNIYTRLV